MAGEGVTKVVKRCDQAKESGKLDLSECQLVRIPDAVYMLMRHTVLDICNFSANVLRRIPAKIATKFPNLTELYLSNNHLSSLPEELRHLASLILLDIGHNQFDIFPQVVYRLEALRKLQAEGNNIKEINVARLKAIGALTEVNLQENPLTEEVHHQLLDIRVINVLVTPRDPEPQRPRDRHC